MFSLQSIHYQKIRGTANRYYVTLGKHQAILGIVVRETPTLWHAYDVAEKEIGTGHPTRATAGAAVVLVNSYWKTSIANPARYRIMRTRHPDTGRGVDILGRSIDGINYSAVSYPAADDPVLRLAELDAAECEVRTFIEDALKTVGRRHWQLGIYDAGRFTIRVF